VKCMSEAQARVPGCCLAPRFNLTQKLQARGGNRQDRRWEGKIKCSKGTVGDEYTKQQGWSCGKSSTARHAGARRRKSFKHHYLEKEDAVTQGHRAT